MRTRIKAKILPIRNLLLIGLDDVDIFVATSDRVRRGTRTIKVWTK